MAPGAVAERLTAVLDSGADPAGPVPADSLVAMRAEMEAVARRAAELVDGHGDLSLLPLRLPKGRVVALGGCERHAVAIARRPAAGRDELSVRLLSGRALDVFVEHEIVEGPVADPFEDLLSWLGARGELDVRDQVIAAEDQLQLEPLASAARAWAGLDPAWWPRTQAAAEVQLADGAVRCAGRTDVELGGRLSGRPVVVAEVKLGGQDRWHHLAEVTHYALLVALRDRAAPAAVIRWYPGGALAELAVTTDVLHTAARRLGDAIGAWAELQVGRPPTEVPGAPCAWCPDADVCPSYTAAPDPFGPFAGEP